MRHPLCLSSLYLVSWGMGLPRPPGTSRADSPASMLTPEARKAVVDRLLAERAQRHSACSVAAASPERAALIETLVQQHKQRAHSSPSGSPTLREAPAATQLPAGTLVSPPSSAGGSCQDLGHGHAHASRVPTGAQPDGTTPPSLRPQWAESGATFAGTAGAAGLQHPALFVPMRATGPQEVDPALLDSRDRSPAESRSCSPAARSVASSATRSLNFASDLLRGSAHDVRYRQPLAAVDPVRPTDGVASPEGSLAAPDASVQRSRRLHALHRSSRGGGGPPAGTAPAQRRDHAGQHRAALLDGIQQKQARPMPTASLARRQDWPRAATAA